MDRESVEVVGPALVEREQVQTAVSHQEGLVFRESFEKRHDQRMLYQGVYRTRVLLDSGERKGVVETRFFSCLAVQASGVPKRFLGMLESEKNRN